MEGAKALARCAEEYRGQIERAAEWISQRIDGVAPRSGLILGTGLGSLVKDIESELSLPYDEIPGFPVSTAPGHTGALHYGRIADRPILAMEGRFHIYEGYSLTEITLPVRVMARLGVRELILSNASGGLEPSMEKGELLIIDDHINLMGDNPLIGPNHEEWGPRFPDMSAPYDRQLVDRLRSICEEEGVRARPGVYAAMTGPCLETRAEYRMLQRIGADAIGMSTVPEVIVAVHEGLRVAGLWVITDLCFPDELEPVVLEEILQVAAVAEPKVTRVVRRLIETLD